MNKLEKFSSVWDALEDNPIKAENMKLRSALMMAITERIERRRLESNRSG